MMNKFKNELLSKGIIGSTCDDFIRNLDAIYEWGYVVSESAYADITSVTYSLYDYNHNLITEYSADSPLRITNGYLAVNENGTCRVLYNLRLGAPISNAKVRTVYHKSTCVDDSPFDITEECVIVLKDKAYYYCDGHVSEYNNITYETLISNGFNVMFSNQQTYINLVRDAIILNGVNKDFV